MTPKTMPGVPSGGELSKVVLAGPTSDTTWPLRPTDPSPSRKATAGAIEAGSRSAGASPFVIGVERRMHRIERDAAALEPLGDFLYVRLAVRVVDMLARSENLDGLHACPNQAVKNARMQPLFHEQIG